MTILEALNILEAAVLECKKRDVNTPEATAALDLLAPYVWPKWVVSQFRYHLQSEEKDGADREGQQQVLRVTFPGIRDSVKELVGIRMDALARKFHETHNMKVKEEIERLSSELVKLDRPWVFVAR